MLGQAGLRRRRFDVRDYLIYQPVLGGGFSGAYDGISSLVHVYEPARRVLSSYTGNLVRLRRDSDSAESDFGYTANGNLDTAAITAWLAGANGYIKTVYDQKGGDDITQTTTAYQPAYGASIKNSHPGMTFDGTNDYLAGAFTTGGALSQPFTLYAVAQLDATAVNDDTSRIITDGDDGSNRMITGVFATRTPDVWRAYAGANIESAAASDANWGIWATLFNGASSQLWINNTSKATGNAGAHNADGLTVGNTIAHNEIWKGHIVSVIIADPNHSTADRVAMQTALNTYWAVF